MVDLPVNISGLVHIHDPLDHFCTQWLVSGALRRENALHQAVVSARVPAKAIIGVVVPEDPVNPRMACQYAATTRQNI